MSTEQTADLGNAVDWSTRAIFANAGPVCLAGSGLYVERPVWDSNPPRAMWSERPSRPLR